MIFSIIIPTFNSQDYLEMCLQSISQQNIESLSYEVIIVDDSSTDNTILVAQTFSNHFQNFRIIPLAENGGPGRARNAGLDNASGDWILFLDSDDALSPDCLQFLKTILDQQATQELDLIGFNWFLENVDTNLNSSKRVGRRDGQYLSNRNLLIKQYLSHRMDGSVIYTTFRKAFIDKHNIRFATGLHEDVDFIFKAYYFAANLNFYPNALYKKRNRNSSIINRISIDHIDGYFRAWLSIRDFLASCNLSETEQQNYFNYYQYGSVGAIATRIREVIRHSTDNEEMYKLFQVINSHAKDLFKHNSLEQYLLCDNTVYFKIVKCFLSIMDSSKIENINKSLTIAAEVNSMSGKSFSCVDLHHSVFLRPNQVRTCCKRFFVKGEMRGDVVLFDLQDKRIGPITSQEVLNAKRELHQKINSGEKTPCDECPFLEFREWSPLNELDIKYLSLEYHSICNLRCSYCSEEYYGGKQVDYNISETLDNLLSEGRLNNCKLVVWGGGEPTLGKDFEYLLKMLAEKVPDLQQRILTNAVKTSPGIELLLAANKAHVIASIDAGTDTVFELIRGRKHLSKVCDNLKRYSEINSSRVTVKYIFTEGNQSISEVKSFVSLIQQSELLKCNFQISSDFKKEAITNEDATAMIIMFGLLRKAGANVVYFDELLRHRLFNIIDLENPDQLNIIHNTVGQEFIVTPSQYSHVVVWGAGQQAKYLLNETAFFKSSVVDFFVDATPDKIGQQFFGKKIFSPEVLKESNLPVVIAAVQGYPLILEQFKQLGLNESRIVHGLIV